MKSEDEEEDEILWQEFSFLWLPHSFPCWQNSSKIPIFIFVFYAGANLEEFEEEYL